MISNNLEDEIILADFIEKNLLDNEKMSISGNAHFLVRKLKSTGWIRVETDSDFEGYITLPSYRIKILRLLYDLTSIESRENFAYVYSIPYQYTAIHFNQHKPEQWTPLLML